MCLTLSVNFPLLLLYSLKICCSRLAFYIQIAIKPLDVSLLFVLLAQHRLLWAIANAKIINLPVHSVISAQTLSFGPLARRLFNGNDTAVCQLTGMSSHTEHCHQQLGRLTDSQPLESSHQQQPHSLTFGKSQ